MEFPSFPDDFLDKLEHISDDRIDKRQEKGFSLNFFDRDYLSLAPIACVLDEDGHILAFANFLVCNTDLKARYPYYPKDSALLFNLLSS